MLLMAMITAAWVLLDMQVAEYKYVMYGAGAGRRRRKLCRKAWKLWALKAARMEYGALAARPRDSGLVSIRVGVVKNKRVPDLSMS